MTSVRPVTVAANDGPSASRQERGSGDLFAGLLEVAGGRPAASVRRSGEQPVSDRPASPRSPYRSTGCVVRPRPETPDHDRTAPSEDAGHHRPEAPADRPEDVRDPVPTPPGVEEVPSAGPSAPPVFDVEAALNASITAACIALPADDPVVSTATATATATNVPTGTPDGDTSASAAVLTGVFAGPLAGRLAPVPGLPGLSGLSGARGLLGDGSVTTEAVTGTGPVAAPGDGTDAGPAGPVPGAGPSGGTAQALTPTAEASATGLDAAAAAGSSASDQLAAPAPAPAHEDAASSAPTDAPVGAPPTSENQDGQADDQSDRGRRDERSSGAEPLTGGAGPVTEPHHTAEPGRSDSSGLGQPTAAVAPAAGPSTATATATVLPTAGATGALGAAPTGSGGPAAGSATTVTGQVLPEVERLVTRGDGTQRVTVKLAPEALGEVRIILTVRRGEVHVRMTGSQAAQDALLQGQSDLHRLLAGAGATSSSVQVGDRVATLGNALGAGPESGGPDNRSDTGSGSWDDGRHSRGSDGTSDQPGSDVRRDAAGRQAGDDPAARGARPTRPVGDPTGDPTGPHRSGPAIPQDPRGRQSSRLDVSV